MTDLARLEHRSCLDCFAAIASHAPTGFVDERDGLRAAVASVPISVFNQVAVAGDPVSAGAVEEALDVWGERCRNLGVLVRRGTDDGIVDTLRARGMVRTDAFPGMVAPQVSGHHRPGGLDVDRWYGNDAYDTHVDLVARAFGIPPELVGSFTTPALLDDPRVAVSVGVVNGEPVTTALGVMTGDAVCLFNVATPPEARGRGYGAAISAHAVQEGERRGARVATLQSSAAGLPVYRRLGFETVVEYEVWSPGDAR
jgi:GNAT superfamily N-acetyltransferase